MTLLSNIVRTNILKKSIFRTYSSLGPAAATERLAIPKDPIINSKKFPEYDVIYSFDSITNVGLLNRMKLRSTILFGVGFPIANGLEVMNLLPTDGSLGFAVIAGSVAFFCHGIGLFCTNVIGYIYAKKNSDQLKISYVGYFGKRHDIDTTYDDVWFPETKHKLFPLFNKVSIDNLKLNLKIFVDGKVIDEAKYMKLYTR
ncbi:hypothetical protein HCN44_005885 [Aphidius gifuensis]|uniref:Transmembrane protein 186 n=1 Tax=Aphidius gifuensis TaxID=684658 RepID=A0A835CQP5_APHGI|nr:uncharacterized protein LOC122852992 [Aphidius gifuensis]KAF7993104.1 hypothetical protein HCN44_005885 [Aphidius gifuensis]